MASGLLLFFSSNLYVCVTAAVLLCLLLLLSFLPSTFLASISPSLLPPFLSLPPPPLPLPLLYPPYTLHHMHCTSTKNHDRYLPPPSSPPPLLTLPLTPPPPHPSPPLPYPPPLLLLLFLLPVHHKHCTMYNKYLRIVICCALGSS